MFFHSIPPYEKKKKPETKPRKQNHNQNPTTKQQQQLQKKLQTPNLHLKAVECFIISRSKLLPSVFSWS